MSIRAEHLNHIYGEGTAFEQYALKDVSFEIEDGQFIGLIGHTGSGRHSINAQRSLKMSGENIYQDGYDMKALRSKVGLVFQYPEHQLFEVDVFSDVCFGPKNQGLSKEEVEERAREALTQVGLDEKLWQQSPFELSGGQKRRVAIAGVLAMEPEVLILDEPTAGLDPNERIRFRNLISELAEERLVLLSTHIVSDVEFIANKIVLMKEGQCCFEGTSDEVIASIDKKVYCFVAPREQVDHYMRNYLVVNVKTFGSNAELRILSDHEPVKGACVEEATLEDAFLNYFGERAGESHA